MLQVKDYCKAHPNNYLVSYCLQCHYFTCVQCVCQVQHTKLDKSQFSIKLKQIKQIMEEEIQRRLNFINSKKQKCESESDIYKSLLESQSEINQSLYSKIINHESPAEGYANFLESIDFQRIDKSKISQAITKNLKQLDKKLHKIDAELDENNTIQSLSVQSQKCLIPSREPYQTKYRHIITQLTGESINQPKQQSRINKKEQQGKEMRNLQEIIENTKFADALHKIQDLISKYPRKNQLLLLKARILVKLLDFKQATVIYQQLIFKRQIADLQPKYELASIYLHLNELDRTKKILDRMNIKKESCKIPQYFILKADYLALLSDLASLRLAKENLQCADKLNEKNPVILSKLGYIYLKLQEYKQSGKYFKRALDLDRKMQYITALAYIQQKLNNYKQSKDLYSEALDREPKNPYFNNNIAIVYMKLSQTGPALRHMLKAIQVQKNNQDFLHNFLIIAFKSQKYKEINSQIQQSIRNSNNFNLNLRLNQLYALTGQAKLINKAWTHLSSMSPTLETSLELLKIALRQSHTAECYALHQKIKEFIVLQDFSCKQRHIKVDTFNTLGFYYNKVNNQSDSYKYYKKAYDQAQDLQNYSITPHYNNAVSQYRQKKYQEALNLIEKLNQGYNDRNQQIPQQVYRVKLFVFIEQNNKAEALRLIDEVLSSGTPPSGTLYKNYEQIRANLK